ncbi:heme peroxidase [Ceratobasidium sp. UAMH 11750]|nr:heme peroxidase [Ceratobasidium sp. UAMH 11750]
MRFEPESLHGANNGLNIARAKMEEVKQAFPWISYGDLWTLGGVCAIQASSRYTLALSSYHVRKSYVGTGNHA